MHFSRTSPVYLSTLGKDDANSVFGAPLGVSCMVQMTERQQATTRHIFSLLSQS